MVVEVAVCGRLWTGRSGETVVWKGTTRRRGDSARKSGEQMMKVKQVESRKCAEQWTRQREGKGHDRDKQEGCNVKEER